MRQDKLIKNLKGDILITVAYNFAFNPHKILAMKRLCLALFGAIAFLFLTSANAANWYVRPSSAGANNGTDWNNAWTLAGIKWSSVSAGDTIYLTGGAYSSLTIGKSGSSGNVISIRRARANNSACTSAAGWSAGFDATVNLSGISGGSYNYVTISGEVSSGIVVNNNDVGGSVQGGSTGMTLSYIEFTASSPNGSSNQGLLISFGNQSAVVNLTVDHCIFHHLVNGIQSYSMTGAIFQYCEFYDINNQGSTGHPNVQYMTETQTGCIWRYNKSHDNDALGISWEDGGVCNNNYFYGNVFYNDAGVQDAISTDHNNPNIQSIYIYNNTFVNEPVSVSLAYAPGTGVIENNIYWNSGQPSAQALAGTAHDYNYSDGAISGETHSVSRGSNPFVNLSGLDFHIISTIASSYPRDKGIALAAPYNVDPDGNIRGANGAWDIGAYEYGSAGTTPAPIVSAITQSGADVDSVTPGLQIYSGSVVQYSGSASDTKGLPLTWQWIYTVNGGSEVVFQSGAGTVASVSFNYTTNTAGNTYVWKLRVSNGGATAESSHTVGVVAPPLPAGTLAFQAASGIITAPFAVTGGYISQSVETDITGGKAVYTFTITNAGNYVIQAMVNAPNDGANSFYVNIDAQPQDPGMIWDISMTVGFEQRLASWRGNGTDVSDQFVPQIFNLTTGTHQLIIVGREANVKLQSLSILPRPPTPQNLHIITGT
jgi:hypothetical protein